jgi:hypothetical protein
MPRFSHPSSFIPSLLNLLRILLILMSITHTVLKFSFPSLILCHPHIIILISTIMSLSYQHELILLACAYVLDTSWIKLESHVNLQGVHSSLMYTTTPLQFLVHSVFILFLCIFGLHPPSIRGISTLSNITQHLQKCEEKITKVQGKLGRS